LIKNQQDQLAEIEITNPYQTSFIIKDNNIDKDGSSKIIKNVKKLKK